MLSFDWNAPPQFPTSAGAHMVVILLEELGERRSGETRLGWKEGEVGRSLPLYH
jgi:hypothetical protein